MASATEQVTKPAMFNMGHDTRAIISRLRNVKVGEMVPYHELEELVGKRVDDFRGNLATARRRLQTDAGMVFDCVLGDGLIRLDDKGISKLSSSCMDSIRKKASRTVRVLENVNLSNLSDGERMSHLANTSILIMTSEVNRATSAKRLSASIDKSAAASLTMAKTLDALRGDK